MTFSGTVISSCDSAWFWVEAVFKVAGLDVVDVDVGVGVEVVLDAAKIDCPLWSSSLDNVGSENIIKAVQVSNALKKCYASYFIIIIRFLWKWNRQKPNLIQL